MSDQGPAEARTSDETVDPAMPPIAPVGRRFSRSRPVRLGDVDPEGRLRLDALTRFTQDVSNDDTTDAELADHMDWIARSTTVDVIAEATFTEPLELTTFCGALGGRWAQRRITIRGSEGAHYEVATVWIHIDPASGRPRRLSEQFVELYGEAAQGRTIKARLTHPAPPTDAERVDWPLRKVDFDIIGHVNNAAYWAAVEESLVGESRVGRRFLVEYGRGISLGERADVARTEDHLWFEVGADVVASASVRPLGAGLSPGA